MRKPDLNRDKGRFSGRRENKVTKVPIIPLEGEERERERARRKGTFVTKVGNFGDENMERL